MRDRHFASCKEVCLLVLFLATHLSLLSCAQPGTPASAKVPASAQAEATPQAQPTPPPFIGYHFTVDYAEGKPLWSDDGDLLLAALRSVSEEEISPEAEHHREITREHFTQLLKKLYKYNDDIAQLHICAFDIEALYLKKRKTLLLEMDVVVMRSVSVVRKEDVKEEDGKEETEAATFFVRLALLLNEGIEDNYKAYAPIVERDETTWEVRYDYKYSENMLPMYIYGYLTHLLSLGHPILSGVSSVVVKATEMDPQELAKKLRTIKIDLMTQQFAEHGKKSPFIGSTAKFDCLTAEGRKLEDKDAKIFRMKIGEISVLSTPKAKPQKKPQKKKGWSRRRGGRYP